MRYLQIGFYFSSNRRVFKRNLDIASRRRFNLKVEFDYLVPDGKIVFFDHLLKRITGKELSPAETDELMRTGPLTPGDFNVVMQKHLFIPEAEITNMALIRALHEESVCRIN